MCVNLGDRVKNTLDGNIGIVVQIFKNGNAGVLESLAPIYIRIHKLSKIEIIEKNSVKIFNETI